MSATVVCPNCFNENAYFEGMFYTCPECDYEWEDVNVRRSMEQFSDETDYERLIQLKQPYFALKQGKVYKCKVDYGKNYRKGVQDITIIPLATEENANRLYILMDAKYLLNINKQFVKEIISKDFKYLYYGGVKDNYPDDFGLLTTECTTDEEGNIVDDGGAIYYGFMETEDLV